MVVILGYRRQRNFLSVCNSFCYRWPLVFLLLGLTAGPEREFIIRSARSAHRVRKDSAVRGSLLLASSFNYLHLEYAKRAGCSRGSLNARLLVAAYAPALYSYSVHIRSSSVRRDSISGSGERLGRATALGWHWRW